MDLVYDLSYNIDENVKISKSKWSLSFNGKLPAMAVEQEETKQEEKKDGEQEEVKEELMEQTVEESAIRPSAFV